MCRRLTLAALAVVMACAAPSREGQALVVVDVDPRLSQVLNHLRVDVFSEQGNWTETQDFPVRSWPVSFSVYAEDRARSWARVRVRAYPEGVIRDYRGERFVAPLPPNVPPMFVADIPTEREGPRLFREGLDRTPTTEPSPFAAIDRLAWVDLAGQDTRITLLGACAGKMADWEGDRTCVRSGALVLTADESSDPEPPASLAPPLPTPRISAGDSALHDDEIQIEGGAFLFGSRSLDHGDRVLDAEAEATPERLAIMTPFLVDRFEVTVARWRDAERRGFRPPRSPTSNNRPLVDEPTIYPRQRYSQAFCTYSDAPMGREDFPITCVNAESARAFCLFEEGDLPSEVEWEYMATAASRPIKTTFATGFRLPPCEDVVIGRSALADCEGAGRGPSEVTAGRGDETHDNRARSVHGLAGNVSEFTRSPFVSYASACFRGASIVDLECADFSQDNVILRGSSWFGARTIGASAATTRTPAPRDIGGPDVGFRCMRRGRR